MSMNIWSLRFTKLKQIMSSPVIKVDMKTPIASSIKLMTERKIGCVVVTKANKPFGMLTERDLLKLFVEGCKPKNPTGKVASYPLLTLKTTDSISDAMSIMQTEKIRRVPIVDESGIVVGIVTDRDIINTTTLYVKTHNMIQWYVFIGVILGLIAFGFYLTFRTV